LGEVRNKILGILDSRSESILIALNGNDFIGTVSLLDTDLVSRPCMTPWIAAVYVEPEFRGNGYATQLVNVAESMAWDQGRHSVYLHCGSELRTFYRRLGYREIEANVGELDSYIFVKIRN
jgi:GNAT superfamily N-acetyltransferase